jgi:colanic acid biosynthesis glycosyl transferase WcaI
MNILIIHQHYYPEMSGTARRAKELAESFVKRGHQVRVLTSFPREYRSMPNETCTAIQNINEVKVLRVKTMFEVNRNVLFRLFSYLSFIIQSLQKAITFSKKSDIVITIAPLSSGVIGALVQIINKKHHHFDVPDILPDLGVSAGMIKNKLVISLLFKIEKWVYLNSKTVSAITHGQIENIQKKGVSPKKLFYVPDWINDKFFTDNLKLYKEKISQLLKYEEKIIISFVGNIGALQNAEIFLTMLVKLNEDSNNNYQLLFIGDGIMLPSLKNKVKALNLNNVTFIGRVKREYIPAYMNLSDILVANYLPNEYMNICIPGKLYEYAMSRKPIIMGAHGEAKNLINKYKLGFAVNPSDVNAFKDAIMNIANGFFQYKPETQRFVEKYSLNKVSTIYEKILEKAS